jgi:hypothetical protein
MINEVNLVLQNPISNRYELKRLVQQLCNYNMNLNCGQCINEAVMLLSNWLKIQGQDNEYKSRAIRGEFTLKQINLFVQVYNCGNEERQKELDTCLENNKALNINGVPYFNIIEIKERLTFNQIFKLTQQYSDKINIIANSDIYFNETILNVRFIKDKECLALSRWDINENTAVLFDRKDSQDVWIFNGAVTENIGHFNLGVPGCDNRIMFELKQSGYSISNPAKTIHALHLHSSNYRTYDHKTIRVPEPYHFLKPHF